MLVEEARRVADGIDSACVDSLEKFTQHLSALSKLSVAGQEGDRRQIVGSDFAYRRFACHNGALIV